MWLGRAWAVAKSMWQGRGLLMHPTGSGEQRGCRASRGPREWRDTSVSWEWPPNTARRGDAAQRMAHFPGDMVALTSKAAWAPIAVARLNQLEPCQDALGHFSVLQKVVWSSDTVFSHCCSVPASAGTIGSCWLRNLNKGGALILVASDPLSWVLK